MWCRCARRVSIRSWRVGSAARRPAPHRVPPRPFPMRLARGGAKAKSPLLLIVHDQPVLEIPQQYRRSIERPRLVIGLQDAIAKVVEVRFGLAANAPWTPALLRGELEALPVGG